MLEREQHDVESEFPDQLPGEAKAIAAVRAVDFRRLLQAQLDDVEEWTRDDCKYRKRLHRKLQRVYELYVLAADNRERETLIQRRCDSAKIANTRASHLTIRLVKLLLQPAKNSVYQYAAALRNAALKKIPVDDFAAALEKGGGIAHFAERFGQKASKLASADADQREDSDETDDEDSGNGKDRASKRRADDQSAEAAPEFEWNDKALKLYAEATTGDQIRQVAEKKRGGRWKVIKARVVS